MNNPENLQILHEKTDNQSTDGKEIKDTTSVEVKGKNLSRKRKFQGYYEDEKMQVNEKPLKKVNNEGDTDEAFDDLMTKFTDDLKDSDNGNTPSMLDDEEKVIEQNTDGAFEDLMAEFADDLNNDKVDVSSKCDNNVGNEVKGKKNTEKVTSKIVEKKSLEEKKREMVKNMMKVAEAEYQSYDSFFDIRIKSPKIGVTLFETVVKDINKVLVKDIRKTNENCGNDFVTMGVIIEKSECKVSGNGKNYIIWKISGFKHINESSVKVLLFGDCFKSHWKLQEGMSVAIVKPTFSTNDNGKDNMTTLIITKDTQVIELGFCIDFGICKSVRTDGKPCSNVVNIKIGQFCAYHLEKHAKDVASRRGTFNSMYSQPNVKRQQKMLLNCHASPVKKVARTFSALPVRKINGALPNKDNIHLLKEKQKQDILMNASKAASCSLNARAILKKQKEKEESGIKVDTKKKKNNVEDFISKLRENDRNKEIEAKKNPMIGRAFKGKGEIIL
uniref:Protein MCM10 homolog (inferred by orthology to a human protein) n=1 Tax=Strongyloides venezuelensis TaxID=75913 RepID=A0A0K0FT97_STRVS